MFRQVFTYLQTLTESSERCRQSCSADCFEILDSAPSKFQLKLKEAMHINWEKSNLNQ